MDDARRLKIHIRGAEGEYALLPFVNHLCPALQHRNHVEIHVVTMWTSMFLANKARLRPTDVRLILTVRGRR